MCKSILFFISISLAFCNQTNAQFFKHKKKSKLLIQEYLPINDSLYVGKYEVSISDYFAFMDNLKANERLNLFDNYIIEDSTKEKINIHNHIFNSSSAENILNFPVSNIGYESAIEFCKWKTSQYNNNPKRKFDKVIFRLPTEKEWEFAASGGSAYYQYPWGGPYLRSKDGKLLCNFLRLTSKDITFNSETNKYEVVLDDLVNYFYYDGIRNIDAYRPNYYGLYNMSGNVAEMVAEKGLAKGGGFKDPGYDVRIKSQKYYSKKSDDIGFRVVMVVLENKKIKKPSKVKVQSPNPIATLELVQP
jgi:formylglycine-generating enzyme required for sulfatase activity